MDYFTSNDFTNDILHFLVKHMDYFTKKMYFQKSNLKKKKKKSKFYIKLSWSFLIKFFSFEITYICIIKKMLKLI